MKYLVSAMIGILAVGLVACKPKVQETTPQAAVPAPVPSVTGGGASAKTFSGNVIETMNAGGYTYVQVDNGKEKIWAAAPQFDVKKGDKVNVPEGMPMQNYESKTLNRKFDVVYFVGSIGKGDEMPAVTSAAPGGAMGGGEMGGDIAMPEGAHPKMDPTQAAKDAKVTFTDLKKADKTISEIYAGQNSLSGKDVTVRGKVVKFSAQIMGKNWVHVQDGSGAAGTNDLTITTVDSTKVGDTVLVSGKISLKKDFGMGYKYDLIIEDGKIKVE